MGCKKLTPVLSVASVADSLRFWTERLGFEKTIEVPQGDGTLAFAAVVRGGLEVMLQSYDSLQADLPELAAEARNAPSFLFVEVDDLDALEPKLVGVDVVKPRHQTFYGMTEISVREPGGHIVTFAQPTGG